MHVPHDFAGQSSEVTTNQNVHGQVASSPLANRHLRATRKRSPVEPEAVHILEHPSERGHAVQERSVGCGVPNILTGPSSVWRPVAMKIGLLGELSIGRR